jgi:ribosomal protein L5
MKQYCDHTTRTPIRIPRHKLNTVEKLLPKIKKLVYHINTESITETNDQLYAIAITVQNITNPNIINLKSKAMSPPWKQRSTQSSQSTFQLP